MKAPRRQPRCSFCEFTGHNRTSCPSLKETKNEIVSRYIELRAKYWNLVKDLPFGTGALIRFVDGESCYNDEKLWITVKGEEVIQIVVDIQFPTRISEKMSFTLNSIGRICDNNYYNHKVFPVVAGYTTNLDISAKRYGFQYWFDLPLFQEKHFVSAGATLDDTVERAKLQRWLNADDIKTSYLFDIKGRGRSGMLDAFEMSTRIVG